MSNLDKDLARRLTELRRARNWPLEDLAERTGISRATLSRIERGDTSPTASVLGKLAAAFGLSMAELFGAASATIERLVPRDAQAVWTDRETGYVRRTLTPAASGYRGAMIEGCIPRVPPLPMPLRRFRIWSINLCFWRGACGWSLARMSTTWSLVMPCGSVSTPPTVTTRLDRFRHAIS